MLQIYVKNYIAILVVKKIYYRGSSNWENYGDTVSEFTLEKFPTRPLQPERSILKSTKQNFACAFELELFPLIFLFCSHAKIHLKSFVLARKSAKISQFNYSD